ncbi:MAG: transposase [Bacteroidetes bacterium]|nr:transposase [Bacteroidota bacterium]
MYPFVWLGWSIHYKVKEAGSIKTKAVHCLLGVGRDGTKDLLGLYINETEGAKILLQVLSDLQNRGATDILIACIDNLKGFAEAIESVFPQTEVQLCVVHQPTTALNMLPKRFKTGNGITEKVYTSTKEQAQTALDELEKNGKQNIRL